MEMNVKIHFGSMTACKRWVGELSPLISSWKGTDTIKLDITINKNG